MADCRTLYFLTRCFPLLNQRAETSARNLIVPLMDGHGCTQWFQRARLMSLSLWYSSGTACLLRWLLMAPRSRAWVSSSVNARRRIVISSAPSLTRRGSRRRRAVINIASRGLLGRRWLQGLQSLSGTILWNWRRSFVRTLPLTFMV